MWITAISTSTTKRTNRKYCVCTGMLFDPARHPNTPLPVEIPQDVLDFIKDNEA